MTVILRILAVSMSDDQFMDLMGQDVYLKSYDIEAHDGRGDAMWTEDPRGAMQFDSAADAMKAWNTQSTVRPLREDGKPNKPLTAFTVEVMTMEDPNDRHRV